MPFRRVSHSLLLPELELTGTWRKSLNRGFNCRKTSDFEVCPKCATVCRSIYDHRLIRVRDAPLRNHAVTLTIRKRRFFCKKCKKPFMEPVSGIAKGKRTTQRYRAHLLWACENFTDLNRVRTNLRCSSGFLYEALYEQLELKRRTRLYPWPSVLGIDEHSFARNRFGRTEFASIIVDYRNKRVFDLVKGRSSGELSAALSHIEGRENVRAVIVDLSDPFKNFARDFFPNAQIIADKFHVLRLLNPTLNKRRTAITGDRRTLPIRRLLLRNGKKLEYFQRRALHQWLDLHPELREIYHWKEALHGFYRVHGYHRAASVLTRMTDAMALSKLPEIKTLRRTLMRWRKEILGYFKRRLTNGRTEGYNNLAKLIQRRAFGYKSFENYRLRLLNACA
ncbi:MAG: ISL3 family transposase [Bdellovibrionota bacterium]